MVELACVFGVIVQPFVVEEKEGLDRFDEIVALDAIQFLYMEKPPVLVEYLAYRSFCVVF